jgi:hypothetical protein
MKPHACRKREHKWDRKPAGPGARCRRPGCGHVWGQPSPKISKAPAPPVEPPASAAPMPPSLPPSGGVGEGAPKPARNAALAARWAELAATPGPAAETPDAKPAPEAKPSAETTALAKMLAPWVADSNLAAQHWIIEWRGYDPNPVDDSARKDLHECVEVLLRRYLPETDVGPWTKLIIANAMCFASMRIGAKKLPPTVKPAPSPAAVRASTESPGENPSQPSSSQPQTSLRVLDGGTARDVVDLPSDSPA